MERVIVITGSMGAGKTTVLGEASDLLTERRIRHAAIDLDALGIAHTGADHDLVDQNLRSVCGNYAAAGIDRLLIAAAVESASELQRIKAATAARQLVVCRLRAPLDVMRARVASRERGIFSGRYVDRVGRLESILDAAGLEHFEVDSDGPVTEVAQEILIRACWIAMYGPGLHVSGGDG